MKSDISAIFRDEKGAAMKLSIYCICIVALLAAFTSPALATNASWNGTWKLDRAKSQMTGDTFTYSMNANGTIRYSNGGPVTYDFACDGKDYTAVTSYTVACKKVSDTAYDFTYKQNGKVQSTDQLAISADGKTMTDTGKTMRPDGTTSTSVDTYDRISGTSGLVGEWKHVNVKSTGADLFTISISGTTLTQRNPAYKSSVTAKLDGSDAPLTGPAMVAGVTVSFKPIGSRQLYSVTKLNGKVIGEDTMTLSADGTTITDVSSSPGQSAKQTYVYEKQ
jgi:hypothetical protein